MRPILPKIYFLAWKINMTVSGRAIKWDVWAQQVRAYRKWTVFAGCFNSSKDCRTTNRQIKDSRCNTCAEAREAGSHQFLFIWRVKILIDTSSRFLPISMTTNTNCFSVCFVYCLRDSLFYPITFKHRALWQIVKAAYTKAMKENKTFSLHFLNTFIAYQLQLTI